MMDRLDYMLLLVVAVAWAAFFLGLDQVPGWEGFGKGLAVGALVPIGVIIGRRTDRRRATRANPN